jgi:murein L,D-transpeptidase YcbB/YkuD
MISQNQRIDCHKYSCIINIFRNGKPELRSNVVVGKVMNQTVIFSAPMRSIVFSPIGISEEHSRQRNSSRYRKNANYLEEHDMEWHVIT